MLGRKKDAEEVPPLLVREGHLITRLNEEAYVWLGARYRWYNKVREAKKGGFPFIGNQNLEEQMEATRSALQLLGRNLNNALAVAFNSTFDHVNKMAEPPEGLPAKIEVPDRNNPPRVTEEQDALLLGFMPVRFLNLAKLVRDKGKGVDFAGLLPHRSGRGCAAGRLQRAPGPPQAGARGAGRLPADVPVRGPAPRA
jgi:hypothetical protein